MLGNYPLDTKFGRLSDIASISKVCIWMVGELRG